MPYTDDPIKDFECFDAKREEELEKLPCCYECDKPIQTETCYEINGELICPECLENNHKKWVEDFID